MTDITVANPKLARWLERMGAPASQSPSNDSTVLTEEKSAKGAE